MAKATPKKDEKTVKVLIDKKSLLAAAKDINKADIADPAINLDDDEAGLKKALLAAAEIIEPEDPLKKETFLLLKQLQEEKPEEDEDEDDGDSGDDGAGTADPSNVDIDEDEDEKSLEDLTVQELQAKCKAAGLPFKTKKTTKAQLIAMLEASAEEPEPDEEPEEKKPAPAKKVEKSKSEKKKNKNITRKTAFIQVIQSIGKKEITVTEFTEKVTQILKNSGKNKVGRLEYESKFFLEILSELGILTTTKSGRYAKA